MLKIFIVIIFFSSLCDCARILGVVPTPSFSHQVAFRSIWKELSRRGHEVVLVTTDPMNDPELNIKEINVSFAYDLWERYNFVKLLEQNQHNPFKCYKVAKKILLDICEEEILHPEVQGLLKNNSEHFDLVMVEFINPVMIGFAKKFKCPYVGLVSMEIPNIIQTLLGNPTHPVAYSDFILAFEGELSFWERVGSTLFDGIVYIVSRFSGSVPEDRLLEKYFGKGLPPLRELMQNVSLVLVNENPAFSTRPVGPNYIRIGGGVHLEPSKNLSRDLQDYLDSAKNGAIYFSLGTNVKSDRVSPQMRKVMLDTFKDLPYKVLWKFDVTDLPDVPKNVKIVKWLPQQDILRHPNVKVFITQGGLQSMEEAIFSNVPLVGIPFIGDQDTNVQKMVKKGFGVYLNKDRLTQEIFREAILEVLNNPKYKERTIEIAELSKDQPMTGLEKAIWWTEYVLRHKGAPHFRNPVMDMPLYQYYLLDVIGVVFGTIFVVFYVSYKIFVCIKNFVFRKLVSKPPKSKVN